MHLQQIGVRDGPLKMLTSLSIMTLMLHPTAPTECTVQRSLQTIPRQVCCCAVTIAGPLKTHVLLGIVKCQT